MASNPAADLAAPELETQWNKEFEAKAEKLKPSLWKWRREPQHLISFQPDTTTYFGIRPVAEHAAAKLPSMAWGKEGDFILDFGIHMVGSLSFKLDLQGQAMDAPCRLRLTFGESPLDVTMGMENVSTWISTAWLPDEILNIDVCPAEIELPRRYSFRYLRVEVIDTSPKFKVSFSNIVCTCLSAVGPDCEMQSVTYDNPLLRDIDSVSIMTLRDCMHTVFEDGPRRDRRLWIGDLRLQALANYATFKDFDLVKRCIYLFAAVPRTDGSIPACVFETPRFIPSSDYIVDYDALFASVIFDYVAASGDVEAGLELWPTVQECVKRALSYIDPSTHTFDQDRRKDGWVFLDWQQDLHRSAGAHGLLIFVLKSVNKLASILGKDAPWDDKINELSTAAYDFLDQDRQVFISGPAQQVSYACAAWLVMSGAFPMEIAKPALLNTLAHPDAVKPLTPYLWHYVCEALALVGAVDECVKTLTDYWGGMIAAGADTFWEAYDPADPKASPYGDVRNNSFCHAWSCTPVYLLRDKLRTSVKAKEDGKITMDAMDQQWIKKTQADLNKKP